MNNLDSYLDLQAKIIYEFKNPQLLKKALTHKSFLSDDKKFNNEQLEFLGDAVIDLIFSEWLIELFPFQSEGDLSKKRASFVNEKTLNEIALDIGLDSYLILGKGEIQLAGTKNPRLLSSALEAIAGAIFQDSGYDQAKNVVKKLFHKKIMQAWIEIPFEKDFKTRLQEFFQKTYKRVPVYNVVKEEGPPHDKEFIIEVVFDQKVLAQAGGKSKKQAEQKAAEAALEGIYDKKL